MKVIENGLVPVWSDDNGQPLVNARDLHEFLESKWKFADWIQGRIKEYGFQDGCDFFWESRKSPGRGRPTKEYWLTVGMSKELCMVESNECGQQARRYFIAMEQKSKELALELASRQAKIEGRIEARGKVIDITKMVGGVINALGGKKNHYINYHRTLSKSMYGETPAKLKERHGIDKHRPVADYESIEQLATRQMAGTIVVKLYETGQLRRDNLTEKTMGVAKRTTAFIESELDTPLRKIPLQEDIRPHMRAESRKCLPPPDNQLRFIN